jgi:acyl-CoA synthetase (NDP forming)/GNAT superfamily N-acetyltransferase
MFRIITDARGFHEYVLLKDGQSVLLRLATAADFPAIERMLSALSPYSLRMRFMGAVAQVPKSFINSLVSDDPRDSACLLAILGEEPDYRVIGLGNYLSLGVRQTAEVAFMVADEFQGRGISSLLLERLAGIAAGAGLVGFEAEVLFENQPMINVLRDSGFETKQALDGGSYHVNFPVTGAVAVRERAEWRERIATANSVARLLRPKVVAVVGASHTGEGVGSLIFRHIIRNGFAGTVYPVNTQAASVAGVKAYPSVTSLPEKPDLVVVAVPAEQVLGVAEEALRAGAEGLLVVTSGFAESGPEGAALQDRLVEAVRSQGARLVGPNCLGLLNTEPEVRLDASLAPILPPVGRIGFYSHSAALGIVILQHASARGLGFSTFVSAGNRADISGNDLLQYWDEDPATDIAMLYLEAFGNPRRFARVARAFSSRKPVLCVKSARSRAGSSLAGAHIGARPVSDVEVDALFQQAGVIRADTLDELFDIAVLLAHQPLPQGNRVAIVGNSGGVVTITADACEARGLSVVGDRTVDLGAFAQPEDYRTAVQAALEDPAVDAAIAIFLCVADCEPTLVGRGIRRGVLSAENTTGVAKPTLLCLMGTSGPVDFSLEGRDSVSGRRTVFPSYRFPESAARALAHAAVYAAYRRQPPGRLLWYDDADAASARNRLEALQGTAPTGGGKSWLEGEDAEAILRCFGIELAQEARGEPLFQVTIRSHPDFGPLIGLRGPGMAPLLRITPLTDNDARALLDAARIGSQDGAIELLGRLSQMVEELPWLAELQGEVLVAEGEVESRVPLLGSGVRIAFTAA